MVPSREGPIRALEAAQHMRSVRAAAFFRMLQHFHMMDWPSRIQDSNTEFQQMSVDIDVVKHAPGSRKQPRRPMR